MIVLIALIGRIVWDVEVPTTTLPAVAVTLLVGAFTFSCIGFALSAAIPSEDAAPAITNAALLPLYFISGIFIPDAEIPSRGAGDRRHLPRTALLRGVLHGVGPEHDRARGSSGGTSRSCSLWGLGALAIAVRFFRWEPNR